VDGGTGGQPTATAADCADGKYTAGKLVDLTAGPASGWRVQHWHGTANDSSTAATNSVTMDGDKTVSVHYESVPASHDWWFPWYDSVNMTTWLLVGNPSTSQTAQCTVTIAGVVRGT
jgi:hypothetical protein